MSKVDGLDATPPRSKDLSTKEMLAEAIVALADSTIPAAAAVCRFALDDIVKLERELELCRAVTALCCKKDKPASAPSETREPEGYPGIAHDLEVFRAELTNVVQAERFNRERFRDDTEFADWAQSRCRHTLSKGSTPPSATRLTDLPEANELSATVKDARRYRFLRDFVAPEDYYHPGPRWTVAREPRGEGQVYRGERLDAAVDKAIAGNP